MTATLLYQTERLRVRRLHAGDVVALAAVYGDADAMRRAGDGQPLSAADCARWVEVTERNYTTRGYGMSAVCLAASGEVAGFCGLVHPDNQASQRILLKCGMTDAGLERDPDGSQHRLFRWQAPAGPASRPGT